MTIIIDLLLELWDGIKVGLMILSCVAAGFAILLLMGGLGAFLRPLTEAG